MERHPRHTQSSIEAVTGMAPIDHGRRSFVTMTAVRNELSYIYAPLLRTLRRKSNLQLMVRRILATCSVSLFAIIAVAQMGSGSIQGTIKDKSSGEPLPFVNIVVESNGTQAAGGATDFDGNYTIKPIAPGSYEILVSYVGYQPIKQTGVIVNANKITFLDIPMSAGVELTEYEVIKYNVPLINKDGGASGGTITRDDIAKMPGRTANSIASTVGGVSDAGTGGGLSIRGARSENTYYYIDGVKVPAGAGTGLPKSAIEEVQVITGGLPANYGDATGGVISITTRGPSRNFYGGIEVLSSGFQSGDDVTDVVGLDKYGYNLLEGSLSGPIFFKKDSVGNKTKPLLGFFVSGQYLNELDTRPSYIGDFRVKKDVRDRLVASPLQIRTLAGRESVVYSSDYLRSEDIENIDTRQNAARTTYLGSAKIDITTTPTINLTMGGSVDYNSRQSYNWNNALLNAGNNTQVKNLSYRGFLRFTQRFNDKQEDEENRNAISNAYYSLQADYSTFKNKVEDPEHQDRYFDYGHVGKFQRFRAPSYEFIGDENAWVQTGFRDTLVTFTPSDANSDVAAINSQYFTLFNPDPFPIAGLFGLPSTAGPYENFTAIQGQNGLLNGDRPRTLYSLWNNIGFIDCPSCNEYTDFQRDQFRISASGSADVGQHAISVGVEYEQLNERQFTMAPVGLWTLARQYANQHILELNTSADPTISYTLGTAPLLSYDRLVGPDRSFFDTSVRNELGLDLNGTDFIEVDALDPSFFSLGMFSADELLNEGNSIVGYYGFDHTGKRLTSRPGFDEFFTGTDENGNNTRLQAPFQPIYVSGYLMDKFAFDDIIFNVGVRVDRYDANQKVLKDKYLWQEAYTAGSAVPSNQLQTQLENRPSNIGDDYVVYLNDGQNPTNVVGYRNGDDWYNVDGEILNDPSVLRTANGIQPYLVDPTGTGELPGSRLKASAFKDYDPAVNIMPRVAFSFPISDEAVFFAHYDVLTQRPASNSRLDLTSYAYVENITNARFNNPDLKPSKTIDYELGFQQVLTKSSSLKISAFYRELRDDIQVRRVLEAWPSSYLSYDNIDFGTVKGLGLGYDLRRTGNIWMRVNYTLQFANGTGSDVTTALNLVNSGQPNLRTIAPLNFDQRHRLQTTVDFRYGDGGDYNGPMWFNKPVFQRTGLNLVTIIGSGTPYSTSSRIVNEGANAGGQRLDGTINGARLPWTFTTDLQIDRDFPLSFGKKDAADKARSANLNIYVLVSNIFNSENIIGVWRATGSPDDDGYLAAPEFQQNIVEQTDPQAYRDLYALKVNDPTNYGSPRTIRLGARLDF